MICSDCNFEYEAAGACPRCGFDPSSRVSLVEAVKTPDPPLANPLEVEFSKLCKEAEEGKTSEERVRQHWARLNEKAKAGDLNARHLVARVALSRQDTSTARKILESLSKSGFTLAQIDLAKMHEDGLGVEKDGYRAIRLFRQAAAKGSPLALFSLANHHLDGGLLRPDPAEAQAILQALVATHPTLFRRQGGCTCANGLSDAEFARKTASQIGTFVKYALLFAIAAIVIAIVWTELNP